MFTSGLSEGRVVAGRGKRSQGSESFNPASDDCGRSKHSLAVWNAPRLPARPAASSGELVAACQGFAIDQASDHRGPEQAAEATVHES